MASYKKEQAEKDIRKINELLQDYPIELLNYIKDIEFTTTTKTRYEYIKDLTKFYNYVADNKQVSVMEVTPKLLDQLDKSFFTDYFHYLTFYEKDGKTVTNSEVSISRKMSSLRSYFAFLFDSDLISSNQTVKIKIEKKDKDIIFLDSDESGELLESVDTGKNKVGKAVVYHKKNRTRDLAIVYLLLTTGIRVSECVGINIGDINIDKCSVHISRKGGKESTVWYSDEASEYIELYYKERIKNGAKLDDPLFLSRLNKRLSVRSIEILIKNYAISSVPTKKITPHKLRSTFATNLYESTSDIYLVAETLGHNDIGTTKKHYANLSNSRKEKARNIVTYKKD